MLEARLGADALRCRIAGGSGNRPQRRGFGFDDDVDRLAPIRRGASGDRGQRHASDQPGRDQRTTKIVEAARIIRVTRLESRQQVQLARRDDRFARRPQLPEHPSRAGIDRLRQRCRPRGMVDDDRRRVDHREGMAMGGEVRLQPVLPGLDALGDERLPRLDAETGGDEFGRSPRRRDDLDCAQRVDRARVDAQCHRDRRAANPGGDLDGGLAAIIADTAEQDVDQFAVLGNPTVDLREVGRGAAPLLQRRIGPESPVEVVVEAGDDNRVSHIARHLGRRRPHRERGRHIGPSDQTGRGHYRPGGVRRRGLCRRARRPSSDEDDAHAKGTDTHHAITLTDAAGGRKAAVNFSMGQRCRAKRLPPGSRLQPRRRTPCASPTFPR